MAQEAKLSAGSGNAASDDVILVDEQDQPVGFESKLKAHQDGGRLHRAFSVFIFNTPGQMLVQQRGRGKYHFGGLWTNACCSHPRRGENLVDAAQQRLMQEFGFTVPLREAFAFLYRATDERSGLTEHEFDHVFFGHFDGVPQPNPNEIDDWKWITVEDLAADVQAQPDSYTPWFCLALERVVDHVQRAEPGRGEWNVDRT